MSYLLLGIIAVLLAERLTLIAGLHGVRREFREEREATSLERTALIHANDEERRSWDAERKELMAANDAERAGWVRERRDLNNRIQVPQAAPFMDTGGEQPPQHVPFDDDEAFAEAQKELMSQWP